MVMPKAAIHENDRFIFWEHHIRFPGISGIIFPKTESMLKKPAAYSYFWQGIF